MPTVDPHETVSGLLSHLEPRDREAARFARLLLASGWEVITCWGPVQMDVWALELARGDIRVRFGIERGVSDGVLVRHPGGQEPLGRVVERWAATRGIDQPQLVPHGLLALATLDVPDQ
ncbi:hypothetical protein ncot_11015 [Nocardioides sp. JQ2195]|uniref:hypothetical protein n=1 Tax=Nocardioides sp. JQ2195 TaxID=2592334 RepID=UPI00143E6271|nr:hypothetical protein [Nocardioides sp. JQ2195]QIX27067.1 hypothetical protein ncot_11015 [Nocardioides sp. JQ2195]